MFGVHLNIIKNGSSNTTKLILSRRYTHISKTALDAARTQVYQKYPAKHGGMETAPNKC
jgi:hypothetical protein